MHFTLTFYDQTNRYALHTTGTQAGFHLAPENGRELEAHDAVEDTPSLLGIDQPHIYLPRMLDGFEDCGFGDFVENDATSGFGTQFQDFLQMPRDGFSLAVFIGGEPYGVHLLGVLFQLSHDVCLV